MANVKSSYDSLGVDVNEDTVTGTADKQSLIVDGSKKFHEAVPLKEGPTYQHEKICGYDGLKVIILSSIIFGLAITVAMVITIMSGQEQVTPHGGVSSDSKSCSLVGANIIKDGGSAVDAGIAAMFCIGVVHSHCGGIGGGGFMVVYEAESDSRTVFDFQATAPKNSTEDMFSSNPELAQYGAKAVAIPGELLGMQAAYDAFSKKKWADLVAPASKIAREGFVVSSSLASAINSTNSQQMSEAWRNIYTPNDTPLKAGEKLVLTNLADTLDKIGEIGAASYFRDQFMNEVIDALGAEGLIRADDFDTYDVYTTEPLSIDYANYTIFSAPAPSGGPGLLSILNILNGYHFSNTTNQTQRYHKTIEAIKFVKAQMLNLGDPEFVDTVENYTNTMLSNETADEIRGMISSTTTYPPSYYTNYANTLSSGGTSHISILDETSNDLVSITHSLNSDFGSGVMTAGGVVLNNIMDQFYWPGKSDTGILVSATNNIEGRKRPQCFEAPAVVWDLNDKCEPHLTIGGKTGSNTIDAIAQVLISFLSLKEDLKAAIDDKDRVYHSLEPNTVVAERDVPDPVISGLKALGHTVDQRQSGSLSMVCAVYESYDEIYSSADSREQDSGAVQF